MIEVNAYQEKLFMSDAQYIVAMGGRQMGKTSGILGWLEKSWQMGYIGDYLYIAKSLAQARIIVEDRFLEAFSESGNLANQNRTNSVFELKNGCTLRLGGADSNPNKWRGGTRVGAILDEFAFWPRVVQEQSIAPSLWVNGGRALFASTPLGRANWSQEYYMRGLDPDYPNWESFHCTTEEGGLVPKSEIELARSQLDKFTFAQEFLGDFVSSVGAVFNSFHHEENVKPFPGRQKGQVIVIACDFNVSPMSAVAISQVGGEYWIFDEWELYDSNTYALCDAIKSKYRGERFLAQPDPTGAARSANSSYSNHTIMRNKGFDVKSPSSIPFVDSRNAVNRAFCDANGRRRLFIDPKCKRTIDCVSKFVYKDDGVTPDKSLGVDHLPDAIRYGIHGLMPISREYTRNDVSMLRNWKGVTG